MNKIILVIGLGLLLNALGAFEAKAQKIYEVEKEYQADVKVFVVEKEYQADLIVYGTDKEYLARASENRGIWYFVDVPYKADKKLYQVEKEYQADLKIYFTDSEYLAGWRNASKRYLMQ